MPPDPKPNARIWDPRAGTRKKRLEGRCRMCGSTRYLEAHHIVPRAQRGDDVEDNLVTLCGGPRPDSCHACIEERRPLALRALGRKLTTEERAYVMLKKGEDWLRRRYGVLK